MPFAGHDQDMMRLNQKETKSERERQIPCGVTYKWNLKYNTSEHSYKAVTYL